MYIILFLCGNLELFEKEYNILEVELLTGELHI